MGRPADWSPLAGADPVPGDPDEVAALGRRLRGTAAEIEQAAARLRTMCTDEFWDSDAGQAFRQRSNDTAGKLAQAYTRYEATATALGTDSGDPTPSTAAQPRYAGALSEAQRLSLQALTSAQDAAATQRQAMSQLHTAVATTTSGQPPVPGALDPSLGLLTPDSSGHLPVRPGEISEITALKGRYNTAADQLAAARALLARAEQTRDQAAHHAAALISDVIGRDGLTDGFWDHITNFIDEHAGLLSTISKVAGWVATIAGTLALCVGWIPVVGQALAAVLGTIALIASVVLLIADGLLAIGGKGSWLDVGLDVIAVASFGLGRAATGAVKDSALLARSTARGEGFERTLGILMGDTYLKGGEEALDRELPAAWEGFQKQVGAFEEQEIESATEHNPGPWPGWGGIVRGFHPVSILRDGFADVGDLKLSNWAELGQSSTWKGARFFLGDPEIHEALASVDKLGDMVTLTSVRGFVANVTSNHTMWQYVTTPAVAVDWANHLLTETGLKDPLLRAAHLGAPG